MKREIYVAWTEPDGKTPDSIEVKTINDAKKQCQVLAESGCTEIYVDVLYFDNHGDCYENKTKYLTYYFEEKKLKEEKYSKS